jgi:hypothetical protein
MKYSFHNLTQFSHRNNVIHVAASNIDDFLWRDTCVSSTQLYRLFRANTAYIHNENYDLQAVFLSKTNSITHGKNVLVAAASNLDDFFSRDTCVCST